jgi:hypothetical protein
LEQHLFAFWLLLPVLHHLSSLLQAFLFLSMEPLSCYLTPTGLGVLEGAITFGAVVLRAAAVFVSVDLSAGFSALFVIKSIRSRPLDATSLNVLTS